MGRSVVALGLVLVLGVAASDARAGEFRKEVPAPAEGRFRARLDVGSVQIEAHDEDTVRVEASASGRGGGRVDFDLRRDAEGVELVGRAAVEGLLSLLWEPRVRVHVRIPSRFSVDVRTHGGDVNIEEVGGSVEAHTHGGHVEVDHVDGDVELRTSGGQVRAEEIQGHLVIRTSGGHIEVSEAAGGTDARTSGGHIELWDVSGPVRARTSGGHIAARLGERPEGTLETSGGNIELEIDEEAALSVDARTSGGRVEVEPPIEVRSARRSGQELVGDINGGGPTLRLRTSGGSIRITVD